MPSREEKLKALETAKASNGMVILTDGGPFIEALQSKIDSLKKTLGNGIDVNLNADELLESLSGVESLKPSVDALKAAIAKLDIPEIPDAIEIKGLEDLRSALDIHSKHMAALPSLKLPEANVKVNVEHMGKEGVQKLLDSLDGVMRAIKDNSIKSDQMPEDFVPVRRVRKINNRLYFDDDSHGGHGGGGGGVDPALTRNNGTAIAVVNPDGTVISAGGGGSAAYSDSGGTDRKGLVDSDRHVQVDVLTSALPSGAATAARQDTGNTSLATLAGTVSGTEVQVDVLTMPTVTVQATNLDVRDLTSVSDSVAAVQSGPWTVTANAGTNLNTSALALETGGNLDAILSALSAPLEVKVNEINNEGIATDIGNASAGTQRVVLATDQPVIPVSDNGSSLTVDGAVTATPEKAATATLANEATSTSSATLLASNSSRKKAVIVNDSAANLYVKYGTTASSTSYTYLLQPMDTLEETNYTGRIDGILASGTGNARTTEM